MASETTTSVQFLGFLIAGAIAAACNVGSRWLLSHLLPYEVAIVLAYLCGMAVAFPLMRNLVFRPSTNLSKTNEVARFVLVNLLGLALLTPPTSDDIWTRAAGFSLRNGILGLRTRVHRYIERGGLSHSSLGDQTPMGYSA